ncbi:MAG: CoA transferase, partial [Actinomycetota bacterium]
IGALGGPDGQFRRRLLGGPVRIQGTPARAPVQISVPQVWRHTGAEAATAALLAHRRMRATGEPQFVDISAQSAMTWTMLNAMEAHGIQGRDFERTGSEVHLSLTVQLLQPTADGYTVCVPTGRIMPAIIGWLVEDGIVDPSWADTNWETYDHRLISGEPTEQTYEEVAAAVRALCARYPKYELFLQGLERGATFAPMNTVADLLDFDHLRVRQFWTDFAPGADAAPVRAPGAYYRRNGNRPAVCRTRPPADTVEETPAAVPAPPATAPPPTPDGLPCAGLKVVDFSWIGVGPITAKALADHGATVVRVESENRIDGLRTQPPFKDGEVGVNRSNFFGSFNTSKHSLAVDLKTDEGRAVARELVAWADVVVESFTPGAMARLGLDYETVSTVNPSVVMVSTNLLGDGSEVSKMAGYGYHAAAIAGFHDVVGWPDLPPDGPWLAYTDTIGPRFITAALLAALDHRDRTGEGSHLEAAQLEVALQFLAPELVRHQLDGELPPRRGNRSPGIAPQGVYPCAGDDQWLALSILDDAQWRSLVEVMGAPAWTDDGELATVAGRLRHHDAIDDAIGAWTADQAAPALERRLARAGIPAGTVQASSQLLCDPQYRHRGFYVTLDHEEVGPVPYAGHQYRILGYEHGPRRAAPCLGQDTFEVLTELLGLDPERVAEIAASGALV